MKKFLLATLSVLSLSCMAMGVACAGNGGESSSTAQEETQKSDTIILNGFNRYQDVAVIYLDPATFDGSLKLNEDEAYIVEGEASYKCYISGTFANQPNLKLSAAKLKNDITDVTEFGLYVYNDNDYAFDVIITAYAGDTVVCAPVATAEIGANNLTFDINRALVQKTGKVITDYSISFSGLKGGSTFYLDNFYVKTTKDAVVLPEAVTSIVNAIDSYTDETPRAALEDTMEQYNELSAGDKQCVTNYDRLSSLLMPYWLSDLAAAQKDDPKTLLYFDCSFGPLQVSSVTAGISSYSYTTKMKYGDEEGSLKVDFAVTSTNWVNLVTTANTLIEEELIEFYVYNDSDQYKAMCVGWKVPSNTNDPNYMILEPHTWTKVVSKSTDLTDSGGSSGAIEICGLSDLTDRRASAPDGTVYFSSFVKKGASQEIIDARVGEDSNTLFFFDRELGLQQANESGGIKDFSASTVFDGASGALKMNYVGNDKATIGLMTAKYELKATDYVVLNVYVELDADYLQLRLGTLYGTHCFNNKWTTVIIPASAFIESAAPYFLLEALNDGGDYKPDASAKLSGNVYFTKAKVYSGEQVKNMSQVDDSYEYSIGSTTFVGKVGYVGKNYGSYNYNPTIYGQWYDTGVALVDDTLRFYARSDSSDNSTGAKRNTVIGMELKEAVACSGTKMYIIASGLVNDPDHMHLQIFTGRESGHFASPRAVSQEVLEDGYIKYCFDLSSYTSEMKYFRLWTGQQLIIPDYEAIMLRDIYFE